jgi:hypothetical protein
MSGDFGFGRPAWQPGLTCDKRKSAFAAMSDEVGHCQHLAKVYDAAHPRAKKK